MTTVLVTGAEGQDGFYLCRLLAARGDEVVRLVRDSKGREAHGITYEVDIRDTPRVRNIILETRPREIYNLAAISSVALSWEQPALVGQVNGTSVAGLVSAAYELQQELGETVSVVHASSSEIFGNTEEIRSEETAIAPTSPYGAAKAYAHQIVQIYRNRGARASNAILFNHESPMRPDNFASRRISAGVARIYLGFQERLTLGSLASVRDWGHAEDFMRAMLTIASGAPAADYVVATGESRTVEDFARTAFEVAGITDWRDRLDSEPNQRISDAPAQRADISLIRSRFGWAPSRSFTDLVREMVEADIQRIRDGDRA